MPNYVKNMLTIEGKNAEETMQKHFDDIGNFDFNTIERMPEDLNIEESTRTRDGLDLYIASINPDVPSFGNLENKIQSHSEFLLKVHKAIKTENYDIFYKHIIGLFEAKALEKKYGDELKDVLELGKRAFENFEKYGVATWYWWSVKHWGTKWNAEETRVGVNGKTIEYLTPWAPSIPIIDKLAAMHTELSIIYEWADEDNGSMAGKAEYENGMLVSFKKFKPYSKEAYELSFELWGNADKFRFDEEKGTYEYEG